MGWYCNVNKQVCLFVSDRHVRNVHFFIFLFFYFLFFIFYFYVFIFIFFLHNLCLKVLKRTPALSEFRQVRLNDLLYLFFFLPKFLILENDRGNINRQEAVSMIPPLLLDAQVGLICSFLAVVFKTIHYSFCWVLKFILFQFLATSWRTWYVRCSWVKNSPTSWSALYPVASYPETSLIKKWSGMTLRAPWLICEEPWQYHQVFFF